MAAANFDRMRLIEESADKMFAIDELTGEVLNMSASTDQRNAGRVSHIGSDGMYAGDRSRAGTPLDISALIAQQEMKAAMLRRRRAMFQLPPQPEPQPQR